MRALLDSTYCSCLSCLGGSVAARVGFSPSPRSPQFDRLPYNTASFVVWCEGRTTEKWWDAIKRGRLENQTARQTDKQTWQEMRDLEQSHKEVQYITTLLYRIQYCTEDSILQPQEGSKHWSDDITFLPLLSLANLVPCFQLSLSAPCILWNSESHPKMTFLFYPSTPFPFLSSLPSRTTTRGRLVVT